MKNGSRGARSTTRRCAAVRNSESSGERVAVTLTRSPPSLSAVRWRLGEKLPKTGKKASFFPKIPFAKPVFGKKRKNLPSHAFRGTGRSDGAPNMARGGASQPQPGWTLNLAYILFALGPSGGKGQIKNQIGDFCPKKWG